MAWCLVNIGITLPLPLTHEAGFDFGIQGFEPFKTTRDASEVGLDVGAENTK